MASDETVLTVGAFARLVGLTRAHCGSMPTCGVLRPAMVDPPSGYRLYARAQVPRAVLLRQLREAQLSLVGARLVLDGPVDEARRVLAAHLAALEARVGPARHAVAAALEALSGGTTGWGVPVSGPELASAVRQVAPAAAVTDHDLGGPCAWTAVALRWRPTHPLRAAFTGAFDLSPLLVLLALAAPVPVLALAAIGAGARAAAFNLLYTTTLQTAVSAPFVARVASVNMLGSLVAVPIGLATVGPVADATSPRLVLLGAAVAVIATTSTVLLVPDVRRLRSRTAGLGGVLPDEFVETHS